MEDAALRDEVNDYCRKRNLDHNDSLEQSDSIVRKVFDLFG